MIKIKAQVWVETVVYTLIGLTIMGILLSLTIPQIEKTKDKSIITQTVNAMNLLNAKIQECKETTGSIRIVNLRVAKGKLEINPSRDLIVYTMENTGLELSEPGKPIEEAGIVLETQKKGDKYNINLTMNYAKDLAITTQEESEDLKVMQAGTIPYKITIENNGIIQSTNEQGEPEKKIKINFKIE
jgi:type II secretory pathway pseudopilin PulG